MKTKQKILKTIDQYNAQIYAIEKLKQVEVELLSKLPQSKIEKLDHIIEYGGEDDWVIEMSNKGLVRQMVSNYERHQVIDVADLLDSILNSNYCETFKEHLEMLAEIGEEPISEEEYKSISNNKYCDLASKKDFIIAIDELIAGGVSSFKLDW